MFRGNMRKENYFIYLIDEMDRKKIKYDLLKLNKMMYFSVAKSKVGFEKINFEAWKNGPVVASERNDIVHNFYASISAYRSFYKNSEIYEEISKEEKESIDYVIDTLGDLTSFELSELSHDDVFVRKNHTPWRIKNESGKKSRKIIDKKDIREYYDDKWFEMIKENKEKVRSILNGSI